MALSYWTSFAEYTPGNIRSQGWTARWVTSSLTTDVTADDGADDGVAVLYSRSGLERKLLSWDALDAEPADIELVARLRVTSSTNATMCGLGCRGSGSSSSANGYHAHLSSSATNLRISRYVSGEAATLATANVSGVTLGAYCYMRLRCTTESGNVVLRAKLWTGSVVDEPGAWTIEYTDTDVDRITGAGWAGLFNYSGVMYTDWFGVATGGGEAPRGIFSPEIAALSAAHNSVTVSEYTKVAGATGYEYRIDEGSAVDIETDEPFTASGLAGGTSYTIQMRAYDGSGPMGDWGVAVPFRTSLAHSPIFVPDSAGGVLTVESAVAAATGRRVGYVAYDRTFSVAEGQSVIEEILNGTTPPTNLVALPGDGEVTLRWMSGLTAQGHRVYRNTVDNFGTASQLGSDLGALADEIVDETVTNDVEYFYWVTALNLFGESAPISVSVTPSESAIISFFTDFTGANPLAGFTSRFGSANLSIVDDSGTPALSLAHPGNTRAFASWDIPGTPADVEILTRMRCAHAVTTGGQTFGSVAARVSGTSPSTVTCYRSAAFEDDGDDLSIYNAGSYSQINRQTGVGITTDAYHYRRFRIVGNQLKSKVWDGDLGGEPGAWTAEHTNSVISAGGMVGVFGFYLSPTYYDWISVALDGATAPGPA